MMYFPTKIAVLIFQCLLIETWCAEEIVVELPKGKVKGLTQETLTNVTFYSFMGIRYGKPPIGKLRFQAPQEVEPWDDVYDATTTKNICYQVNANNDAENEDCLFLNVYSPINPLNDTSLLPVMVHIHGGGFIAGSGEPRRDGWGPNFFIEYDVVIVTINYRLGPFGFFFTGDKVIPGNAGLKDQTLALKWVQENIKYFNGDPQKVTIFGQSAGSASVSYHILSPKSAGLFRAAICQSGSALSPWAYQRDQKFITFQTAALLNSSFQDSDDSSALLDYLVNVDASQIDAASATIYANEPNDNLQIQQGFYYSPVIEVDDEDAFITEMMFEAFEKGNVNQVPLMIGMTAEESISLLSPAEKWNSILNDIDNNLAILVPRDMHLHNMSETAIIGAADAIMKLYSNTTSKFTGEDAAAIRYFSDQSFTRSIIKQAELQAPYNDVFFYEFSYDGVMGDLDLKLAGTGNVSHAEDTNYLWSKYLYHSLLDNEDLSQFPEDDVTVHYRMMKLWTNFAKFLNPTPDKNDELLQNIVWPKVNGSDTKNLQYLDIGKDLVVKANPRQETYAEWQDIYDTFAEKPYDTY